MIDGELDRQRASLDETGGKEMIDGWMRQMVWARLLEAGLVVLSPWVRESGLARSMCLSLVGYGWKSVGRRGCISPTCLGTYAEKVELCSVASPLPKIR